MAFKLSFILLLVLGPCWSTAQAETVSLDILVKLYEDNAGSLGAEIIDDTVDAGETFFVEILAGDFRTSPGIPAGLIGLGLDIGWDAGTFEEIDSPFDPVSDNDLVTSSFVISRQGTLDNLTGTIDELGGGSLPTFTLGSAIGVGAFERFSLLHFQAEAATISPAAFSISIGSFDFAFADGFDTSTATVNFEAQTITVISLVPEPSSLIFLSMTGICLIGYGWRQKQRQIA